MNSIVTPVGIAQAVARNITPLVGIIFFQWSAGNVLILYLLDTLLSIAAIIAGLAVAFLPPTNADGLAARINTEVGYVAMALFTAAFLAIPLGMPVGIALAVSDFSFRDAFHDIRCAWVRWSGRSWRSGRMSIFIAQRVRTHRSS